jgi:hypothetical protein
VWFLIFYFAGRFDVHSDTIIRTEESRSMGAKFLDDADLRLVYNKSLFCHSFIEIFHIFSSREQCLRLCCETDGCDVFVFEEKVSEMRAQSYNL